MDVPSQGSGELPRAPGVSLRSSSFPFLSLPPELRRMIYSELWTKTPYSDAAWAALFDVKQYAENRSIILTNRQVHNEALDAIYRHTTWALKICADMYPYLEDMTRGFRFLQSVELRVQMADWLLLQLRAPCPEGSQQKALGKLETFQSRTKMLAATLARMPALKKIVLTWVECTPKSMGHIGSSKCLLGCKYPGGVPELVKHEKAAAMQSKATKSQYFTSMAFSPGLILALCPVRRLTEPKQPVDHYWRQVRKLEELIGQILAPLRVLRATCAIEKGVIDVYDGAVERPIHAMERAFSNCVDAFNVVNEEQGIEVMNLGFKESMETQYGDVGPAGFSKTIP